MFGFAGNNADGTNETSLSAVDKKKTVHRLNCNHRDNESGRNTKMGLRCYFGLLYFIVIGYSGVIQFTLVNPAYYY